MKDNTFANKNSIDQLLKHAVTDRFISSISANVSLEVSPEISELESFVDKTFSSVNTIQELESFNTPEAIRTSIDNIYAEFIVYFKGEIETIIDKAISGYVTIQRTKIDFVPDNDFENKIKMAIRNLYASAYENKKYDLEEF